MDIKVTYSSGWKKYILDINGKWKFFDTFKDLRIYVFTKISQGIEIFKDNSGNIVVKKVW